jgi:signal peptidase I
MRMAVEGGWLRRVRRDRFWVDALLGLLIALILGIVLKTFVLCAVYVPSSSMEGTLLAGDYVLVNKLGHSIQRTRIGDVVLFHPPAGVVQGVQRDDLFFVKRCIATGGDTLEFVRGGIAVNRRPLLLPETAALWKNPDAGFVEQEGKSIIVPEGYLFLLGDNPSESYDSRAWGCIPERNVIGAAAIVYWSICPSRPSGEGHGQAGAIRWSRIGTVPR